MKKRAILIILLVLISFMVGSVSANGIQIKDASLEYIIGSDGDILYSDVPEMLFLKSIKIGLRTDYGDYYKMTFDGYLKFNSQTGHFSSPSLTPLIVEYRGKSYRTLFEGVYDVDKDTFDNDRTIYLSGKLHLITGIDNELEEFVLDVDNIKLRILYLYSDPLGMYFELDEYNSGAFGRGFMKKIIIGDDYEERISALESWKQTIDSWKTSITTTISSIWASISGYATRIEALENQNISISCTNCTSEYLRYLSSSDRKKMVCGYAEDNNLTHIEDLGYICDIAYRYYSSGRVKASCRCNVI